MPTIEIDCFFRHCTDTGIKRENLEWQAYKAVKLIKGETINGTFSFQIGGMTTAVNTANARAFLEEMCARAALRLRVNFGTNICIVPIPNSEAVVGNGKPFRTFALARRIAQLVGAPSTAIDLLRWHKAVGKAHLNERARDADAHKNALRVTGNTQQPIVLFDDVVTSGSQMYGAEMALRDAGMVVSSRMAFAEVINKGQRSDAPHWKKTSREQYLIADMFNEL